MIVRDREITILVAVAAVAAVLAISGCAAAISPGRGADVQASVQIHLAGFAKTAELVRTDEGSLYFELRNESGRVLRLTPDELAERVFREEAERPWWGRLLNISSTRGIAWVGLGFVGQLLFTGRMLVQWVVSERRRQSVVPTTFWWLSLGGATLLLAYFGWRRDIVGVMGQLFGWIVYVRNLRLVARTSGRMPAPVRAAAPTVTSRR